MSDFVSRVGSALDGQVRERAKTNHIRDERILKMALMYRAVERFFEFHPELFEEFMIKNLKEDPNDTRMEREVVGCSSKRRVQPRAKSS